MDIGEVLALLVIGVITASSVISGLATGRPKKVKDQKIDQFQFMTPWLLVFIYSAIAIYIGYRYFDNFFWVCGGWLIGGSVLGNLTERMIWRISSPEKADAWLQNALEKKRITDEEQRKQLAERLAKTAEGIFMVGLQGERVKLEEAYCYYYNPPGFGLEGAKTQKRQILISDDGVNLGKDFWYRSQTGAAMDVGGLNPLSLASMAATTENVEVSIPWSDVSRCIVDTVKRTQSEYHILFYRNAAKNREEWIAIYLFSPEEKKAFQEKLKHYGVEIIEQAGALETE